MKSNFEVIKDKNSDTFDELLEELQKKSANFKVHGFTVDREGFYCALVEFTLKKGV